jgi:hypothetical protein
VGDFHRFLQHQRHRAVFLRRQVHRTGNRRVFQLFTGDDKVQIDMGEQARRLFATF